MTSTNSDAIWVMSAQIMRKIGLLPCALSALIVSACGLPSSTTYFKPSAPGAEYTQSMCAAHFGPVDRAVMSGPEGIMIGVEIFDPSQLRAYFKFEFPNDPEFDLSGIGVAIAFYVPATLEDSVRFGSGIFQLTDDLTKTVYEYRAEYVLDFSVGGAILDGLVLASKSLKPELAMRRIDIGKPLPGISRRESWYRPHPKWLGRKLENLYYIVLRYPQANADQYALRLPPVLVGSTTYQFPVVQFRRVTETIWYPLNC